MSKTQDAIKLVEGGMPAFQAAKQVGLAPNALYVALKRKREKEPLAACPCCGSMVKPEQIKAAVPTTEEPAASYVIAGMPLR